MIYKYYPDNEHTYDALTKAYFFFSKTAKLNDPYDTSFSLIKSVAFIQKLNQLGMNPDASQIIRQYGTCSFSKSKSNMHLWALYASCFAGIVVGYDEELLNNMPMRYYGLTPLVEVDYVNEPIDFGNNDYSFNLKYQNSDVRTLTIGETLRDYKCREYLFLHLCSMKHKKTWENEEELRLIAANQFLLNRMTLAPQGVLFEENGYKIPIPENSAKEIIVGHNFTKQAKLIHICEKLNIQNVYKTVCKSPFDVEIEAIS